MPEIVQSLFALLGVDIAAPVTMAELLPYMLIVLIGWQVILYMLDMIKYFAAILIRGGRLH